MNVIITVLVVCIVLALIVGPIVYWQIRKAFREQKNFERGLKMVPLKIHLPPPSDDTDGGGRDARDVIDENISKAQVLYGILSSIFKKGLKSKFYGQRHLSFEIVAVKGSIDFYAAVPVILVDVVRQAIVSAYPSARLEEVEEHNIFSKTGKLSGTAGGELTLKENYAYPLATYQDIKRDPIQSILNSLSTLEKEDGAGIQILLRPAPSEWRSNASEVASKKRKGKKSKKGLEAILYWFQELFGALIKPPEGTSGEGADKPELSSADQAILESIDEKTRYPGFETHIRVVASSDVQRKSESLLGNVVAAFALFNAQGKNGFSYTPAKDIDSFVTAYIMRFFPPELDKSVLNTVELATLFHFPDQKNIPTSQLERQQSKQVDGPRNMAEDGMLLGYNVFRGIKKPIKLALGDRQRHMYAVGQTGTGKSTFLENLALQDMINGNGFAFVDPHGDTAENLLAMVPKERTEDVIYFCPADMDYPMGLNMFEFSSEHQKDFLIQESLNMLYKLYDPTKQGIIGPRFERIFTNCALLLMADPVGGTFVDIPKLLIDPDFMKGKLKYVKDQNVLDFWTKEWPNSQRSNDAGEITSWVVSKFGAFLSNEMMRNIIGQTKSSFNLRDVMDNKKILIVNLSKGRTGDLNSKLLGMIFVMKFQAAAMSRSDIPESERQDFALYVDEFQNFSTDSFATIMSEARKYHLNLIVANQFTTQLSEEIRDAVFGNMGTVVTFRVGQNDVESLTRYYQPLFNSDDLLRIPNYNAVVRTLINGVPTQPFSMAALPPLGNPNPQLGKALRQLSHAKYGRPKSKVEKDIFKRLESVTPARPKPRMGAPSPFGVPGAQASSQDGGQPSTPRKAPPSSSSSFLDDWLAKRKLPAQPSTQKPVQPTATSPSIPNPLSPTTPASASSTQSSTANPVPAEQSSPAKIDEPQSTAESSSPSNDTTNNEPTNLPAVERPKQKNTGEIKIAPHHGDQGDQEDTIFIDKDGNLQQSSPEETSATAG
ncbi:hypothetical protein BH23PAT2_BH23PAT2_07070 [soil metagenome]